MLHEYLPEGMSVTEAARRFGVSRQTFSALLNGRTGVSAEMSIRRRIRHQRGNVAVDAGRL